MTNKRDNYGRVFNFNTFKINITASYAFLDQNNGLPIRETQH
jgi:hypothetical protein